MDRLPCMLPPAFRWSHGDSQSTLYIRYGCVAWVKSDGWLEVPGGWGGKTYSGQAANRSQGIRFVERLIEVRGSPWKPSKRLKGHRAIAPCSAFSSKVPNARVIRLPDSAREFDDWGAEIWKAGPLIIR